MINYQQLDRTTRSLEKTFVLELKREFTKALLEINKQLVAMGARADITDYAEMAKYNRLDRLQLSISKELSALSRGTPQKIDGYLTSVYMENYEGVTKSVSKVAGITFNKIERGAVYKTIQTPLQRLAIEDMTLRVKQNIRRDLVQGIVRGEGIPKISKRIQKSLEGNLNNATRIARTETNRVMGQSRLDAFKESEKKGLRLMKMWVATSDGRVRDSHADLDGTEKLLDEPFDNGLMYPGDQSQGLPEETINCRCTMTTRVMTDEEEKLYS